MRIVADEREKVVGNVDDGRATQEQVARQPVVSDRPPKLPRNAKAQLLAKFALHVVVQDFSIRALLAGPVGTDTHRPLPDAHGIGQATVKGVDGIAEGEDAASGLGEPKVLRGLVAVGLEAFVPLVIYDQVIEGVIRDHFCICLPRETSVARGVATAVVTIAATAAARHELELLVGELHSLLLDDV